MSQAMKQANKCKNLFMKSKRVHLLTESETESLFDTLMKADPNKGLNCHWLLARFKDSEFGIDDIPIVYDTLNTFLNNRISLPENKRNLELYKYKDIVSLNKRWNDIIDVNNPIEIVNDEKIIYDGKYGKLSVPITKDASCRIGSGTKWCTAATTSSNMFEKYNKSGPLYVWYDNTSKKKYQFSFDIEDEYETKGEFRDSKNESINDKLLEFYKNEHPILKQLFEQERYKEKLKPEYLYNYAMNTIKGRTPDVEYIIMKDPKYAILYAKNIIKGRWIEAEPYIFDDEGDYAISYIQSLSEKDKESLKPRILRQATINPSFVFAYARYIIKGRWYEMEPYIIKNPYIAYSYASRVIKDRWIEAEPYIMKDPKYAVSYANDVIKDRWIEAEPYIMKDQDEYDKYKIYFDMY